MKFTEINKLHRNESIQNVLDRIPDGTDQGNTPVISIIVPIYQVEPYFRKCMDSILTQTYSNLEIILVDDGSPDGCPAICDEDAKKDGRVIVIHHKNEGVSSARNAGLDVAKGDYISFVDGDDWIEPEFIEVLYEVIKISNSDIAESSHCINDAQPAMVSINEYTTFSSREAMIKILNGHWDFLYVWRKLYQRKTIESLRFSTSLILTQDGLFAIEAIANSKKIAYIHYQGYHYVIHGDSTCHAFGDRFWITLNATDLIIDVIKKYDKSFALTADKCAVEYALNLSKEAEAKGKFNKYAYQKVVAHIRKYKDKDLWTLLSKKEKCWCWLLFIGREMYITGRKLSRGLKKLRNMI